MFHPRIIHSIRSPNKTNVSHKLVFIQWAYRWLHPVDANTTSKYVKLVKDPYLKQLLGLSTKESSLYEKYASGRSGWYYPSDEEVPLKEYVTQLYGSTDKREFNLA